MNTKKEHPNPFDATDGAEMSCPPLTAIIALVAETVRNRNQQAAGTDDSVLYVSSLGKDPSLVLEPLDIFIKMEDGTYVWKAAADSFELAKSTVERLATNSPGEYMIFSQTTGNKVVVKDGLPEPGAAS